MESTKTSLMVGLCLRIHPILRSTECGMPLYQGPSALSLDLPQAELFIHSLQDMPPIAKSILISSLYTVIIKITSIPKYCSMENSQSPNKKLCSRSYGIGLIHIWSNSVRTNNYCKMLSIQGLI